MSRRCFGLDLAWTLFGTIEPGWARVQAICDFAHRDVAFGYEHARVTRTACEAYEDRRGVCRDYVHLAMAFCRAVNVPARYSTGYLSDAGTPLPHPPGDFAAWFEAYLGGQWYTFDTRNNVPRVGRILLARGRDADVAISTTFGPNTLERFEVWTDGLPLRMRSSNSEGSLAARCGQEDSWMYAPRVSFRNPASTNTVLTVSAVRRSSEKSQVSSNADRRIPGCLRTVVWTRSSTSWRGRGGGGLRWSALGAFPMSRSRAHTHRRHGHPLQTVPSAGLIERPPEKNRVDALR